MKKMLPQRFGAMINDPNGDQNAYRPLSQYGDVPVSRHTHYQNYNALQTLLSRQGSRFSYTAAYTWSKALGYYTPDDTILTNYEILKIDQAPKSLVLPDMPGSVLPPSVNGPCDGLRTLRHSQRCQHVAGGELVIVHRRRVCDRPAE